MDTPDITRLEELFDYYDTGMGALVWKVGRNKDGIAGTEVNHGQDIRVRVDGKSLSAAKIVWAMHYGYWPEYRLRHKNHDRTDIRIANLELTSRRDGPGR